MNAAYDGSGRFDFGLTPAQEDHALRLHRESIVFDMLSMYAGSRIFAHYPQHLRDSLRADLGSLRSRSELLVKAIHWPFEMALQGRSELIRVWLEQSGLTCGAYDIDLPTYDGGDPFASGWHERLSRLTDLPWLRRADRAHDIRQAKLDGAIALYANYQPVVPVLRDLNALERAKGRGLRSFMLTYNRMDHIGVGCTERVDAGLSMFGVEVVRRCNELGVMVDVSHCGRLTTLDACRHSAQPVNANHTMARALYDHPRGKTDEELRAIADTGGVIGIVAVPYFLSVEAAPTIEHMLDHIDYVAERVGWQHVAIGTDWPIQAPDEVLAQTMGGDDYRKQVGWSSAHRRDVTQRLVGFEDCRDLPNLTRGLVKRGYTDEQIRAVLGENALRVFGQVCG